MPRKVKGRSTAHPTGAPSEHYLCLICRQPGHLVQSCPHFQRWERNGVKIPLVTDPTHSSPPIDNSSQTLCQRCMQLSIRLDSPNAHPFVLDDQSAGNITRANRKMKQIPPLGPVKTIPLLSNCPLCRLLFDITYLTENDIQSITKSRVASDGQLALIPAWTIHRLERQLDWDSYQFGKGPYARCIYTSVTSKNADERTLLVDSVVDAFGLVDDGKSSAGETPALGVREVDPRTPNYSIIKGWFHRCEEFHHITCRPTISHDLQKIKLVDVETRQIVMYPPDGCDYIALSYVWGGVDQASYKVGDVLPQTPPIPSTLEDAMLVTRYLGKRYLWADSLCIEQGNSSDKAVQIPLMSAIYTGAWATIINIAGRSAHSGLPRVGKSEGVPQISCNIGGKRRLSIMPTLSQQISRSIWATRAWTFQEGLLSPRRLFFTHHQVYFECNLVQCCESLDDSRSPFHTSLDEQRQSLIHENECAARDFGRQRGPECVLGQGILRDPFRPLEVPTETDAEASFQTYLNLVHSYTEKKMTQDSDSINAFSAVLTRLMETDYKRGFVGGLPIEELPQALLWVHGTQPRRRAEFPAWSWTGWEGVVRAVAVMGAHGGIGPPLRIWRAGPDGRPELVYAFNPVTDGSDIESESSKEASDEDEDEDGEDDDEGKSNDNPTESDGDDAPEDESDTWGTDSDRHSREADEEQDSDPCSGWITERGPDFDKKVVNSFWDGYQAWVNSQSEDKQKSTGNESGDVPQFVLGLRLTMITVPTLPDKSLPDPEQNDSEDTDPVELLAKAMLAEPSVQDQNISPDELLIEGITLKLTFRKDRLKWGDDSDREDTPDGIHSERCLVNLEGLSGRQQLRIYGHDAVQLIKERGRMEQEFLLLSRDIKLDSDVKLCEWHALLWIDRDGNVAKRVGVASLRLAGDGECDEGELLACCKPARRLFKLR